MSRILLGLIIFSTLWGCEDVEPLARDNEYDALGINSRNVPSAEIFYGWDWSWNSIVVTTILSHPGLDNIAFYSANDSIKVVPIKREENLLRHTLYLEQMPKIPFKLDVGFAVDGVEETLFVPIQSVVIEAPNIENLIFRLTTTQVFSIYIDQKNGVAANLIIEYDYGDPTMPKNDVEYQVSPLYLSLHRQDVSKSNASVATHFDSYYWLHSFEIPISTFEINEIILASVSLDSTHFSSDLPIASFEIPVGNTLTLELNSDYTVNDGYYIGNETFEFSNSSASFVIKASSDLPLVPGNELIVYSSDTQSGEYLELSRNNFPLEDKYLEGGFDTHPGLILGLIRLTLDSDESKYFRFQTSDGNNVSEMSPIFRLRIMKDYNEQNWDVRITKL